MYNNSIQCIFSWPCPKQWGGGHKNKNTLVRVDQISKFEETPMTPILRQMAAMAHFDIALIMASWVSPHIVKSYD